METRKFKPGDRVFKRSDGVIMEVIKYATEHDAPTGGQWNLHDVECVWFDENKERHKAIFDQRTLTKAEEMHGLDLV